jgi:NTE family protein
VISVDGEGSQDTSVASRKAVGGIFSLFGLVSGGQIDRYNFETLTTLTEQIRFFARTIAEVRCAQSKVIDGTRCDDVQAELIHLSLASLPDSPQNAQLQAIPTGLTIKREDVDLLVQAGHDVITGSPALRQFIAGYPPAPQTKVTPEQPPWRPAATRRQAQLN